MHADAIGFSTSRTLNHRTLKGAPTPSLRASEAELRAIALGLEDAGRGVLEYISDWNTPDTDSEFAMVRRLVRKSGRPLSYSLAHWGRDRARCRLPVERLVKKLTADNARAVGLMDRGLLAPGMKADVNVIDFDRLRVESPAWPRTCRRAGVACCSGPAATTRRSCPGRSPTAMGSRRRRCPDGW